MWTAEKLINFLFKTNITTMKVSYAAACMYSWSWFQPDIAYQPASEVRVRRSAWFKVTFSLEFMPNYVSWYWKSLSATHFNYIQQSSYHLYLIAIKNTLLTFAQFYGTRLHVASILKFNQSTNESVDHHTHFKQRQVS